MTTLTALSVIDPEGYRRTMTVRTSALKGLLTHLSRKGYKVLGSTPVRVSA